MNTEKEKERTVTGENEDITVNTLYQQIIAQKKDEEVCMKLNSEGKWQVCLRQKSNIIMKYSLNLW